MNEVPVGLRVKMFKHINFFSNRVKCSDLSPSLPFCLDLRILPWPSVGGSLTFPYDLGCMHCPGVKRTLDAPKIICRAFGKFQVLIMANPRKSMDSKWHPGNVELLEAVQRKIIDATL